MGEVELFEIGEVGEAVEGGEAIGLDGEDVEVCEGVQILGVC